MFTIERVNDTSVYVDHEYIYYINYLHTQLIPCLR